MTFCWHDRPVFKCHLSALTPTDPHWAKIFLGFIKLRETVIVTNKYNIFNHPMNYFFVKLI